MVILAMLGGGVSAASGTTTTSSGTAAAHCAKRVLILSAFPAEIAAVLAKTTPAGGHAVAVGGRTFYLGRLHGQRVVEAMTGIGLVNARRTTMAALDGFRCHGRERISAIVFSGVAGGDDIGDVIAPYRWTENGKKFFHVSRAMARIARKVAHRHHFTLRQRNPSGDPLCTHLKPNQIKTVTVTHKPRVELGGKGESSDPFGGNAFPCVPGAGDVFGCKPCDGELATPTNPTKLLKEIAPFVSAKFIAAGAAEATPPGHYVVEDMETAAVAKAAHHAHVPFLGFRGVSDGGGDPLHLPGFPAEFFVYRQLAADNAAAVTAAFIRAWHARVVRR